MQFTQLGLAEPILRALGRAGYSEPTPIQERALPPALAGRDLLGCAQTGTGKTAAFSLPILQQLAEDPAGRGPIRALVVTPTRELAAQIGESLTTYGQFLPLRSTVIFGGVSQARQVSALRRGVDILVATPGRLLDLISQGYIRLGQVEVLVLDEADRMLDMGFLPDIRRIVREVPDQRQTLLFSATMPREIRALADGLLCDPVSVSITPQATAAETVAQEVYLVARENKVELLRHLLDDDAFSRVLVFTRTKHGADRVAKKLTKRQVVAAAIHGGKSQGQRQRALAAFKNGDTRVLVASDIAARGLDIDEVSHVVNFDLPNEPETYVHRIGRTGRAGASGIALSFCAHEERGFLRAIEDTVKASVPISDHPFAADFGKLEKVSRGSRQNTKPGRPGAKKGGGASRPGSSRRRGGRRRNGSAATSGRPGTPARARRDRQR